MSEPDPEALGCDASPAPVPVFVSIGSNIEPERHIRMAVQRLRERFGPLTVSPVYRSAAEGFEGEEFLNLVVGFSSGESPHVIVEELEKLHAAAGRVRGNSALASRTLDLDLLLYGDQVLNDGPVRVPRTDVTRYGFVLGPLADIAPDVRHPVTGERLADLWARFDKERHPIRRLVMASL